MTTLPKLLAMGQKMPPLREVAILNWVQDGRYRESKYIGQAYDLATTTKLKALGCVFIRGWIYENNAEPPPEWPLIQPGGA